MIALSGKRMSDFRRWICAVPIALSMIGIGVANENAGVSDTAAAASAVAAAETAVKRADARHALWTSAEDALRKARRALQEGNIATALEQARVAQTQSELGIAQTGYPLFR
jgi:hypothetical protein